MTITDLHQKTVLLCSRLVQAESTSGREEKAAKVMMDAMREWGYDEIRVDALGNVIGVLKGNRPGHRVLLDGHIDTVPITDPSKWTQDPFGGKIVGDRLYGRGTSDMKGADAAMVCAAGYYAQQKKRNFPGEIYVAGVVHEELFEGVASRSVSQIVQPDYVIIGESTNLNLKIGQRGRAEVVVETTGKSAHSANPEKGINAVRQMMKLLAELDKLDPYEQPGLGKAILELTDIISSPYPGSSVMPERCIATFDRRLLVGDNPQSILLSIRQIIDRLREADPSFEAKTYLREEEKPCYTGGTIRSQRFFPAWRYDEAAPFVQAAYKALQTLGTKPEITCYSFCTNGSHYAGEAGIPTIGFGPSRENLAHTVDEYILLEQLHKASEGYCQLIDALLHLN
ncbi:MAG: YgeY family selenium metabolism-linked hydrolase [Clostridia bacterium]|nr:YgeY family selenium metabolism-linked hydrolase [Clostridia bacterium]